MEMDRIPTAEALKKGTYRLKMLRVRFATRMKKHQTIFSSRVIPPRSYRILLALGARSPTSLLFSLKDLLLIHKDLRASDKKKDAVQGIISIACWSLWCARYNAKFSNIPIKIESIISEVKALGFLWFVNRSKYKEIEWGDWCSFVNM
ncbi:hypothetical protein HanRHA438_Chr04g0171501 [Helianthus annuus]|nr:hypothetical protein HanIR_Chr04g0174421 [Helianthus annuus]KAJ0926463.1 hypothetical protein HanRHA438_Chr04g0171501 [Helianthus annuus]